MLDRVRYFTPDEANALLPRMAEAVARVRVLIEKGREIARGLRSVEDPAERERLFFEVKRIETQVRALLHEIQREGVEVKGLHPALLDFPALRYGQEVYLCWREGEERIEHWHPLHTGFAGRQRVHESERGAFEWCN